MPIERLVVVACAVGLAASIAGCGPPPPYVRYQGDVFRRPPKNVSELEVLRGEPPASRRFSDLGTVIVTCPSQSESADPYGMSARAVGGCAYEYAAWRAREKAASVGADGIHSIQTTVNGGAAIVSLTASAFVYLPQRAATPPATAPAPAAPAPSVEERLKTLDKLRADQLVTPEEYAKKRAEILGDI